MRYIGLSVEKTNLISLMALCLASLFEYDAQLDEFSDVVVDPSMLSLSFLGDDIAHGYRAIYTIMRVAIMTSFD